MVSLRSASSPSSTRSPSRENTPEPAPAPNRRRSSRTSTAARRKSSRLSVTSAPPKDVKQSDMCVASAAQELTSRKDEAKDANSIVEVESIDEHKTPSGASQIKRTISQAEVEDKENVEIVKAARSEKEDSPLTDQDEEVSSPRSSRSSDALALIEAQKYIQPTPRRRRATPQVFDEASTEEEDEPQREIVGKVEVEPESAVDEDTSTGPVPANEPELLVDPSSPPSPELAASDERKAEQVATSIVPDSSEPATPVLPNPPSESIAQVTTDTSTRSRRKRGGSPVVVAPKAGKRQRTSAEVQAKAVTSLSTVDEVPQYFEVIVLGDPNALVNVKMPRQSRQARNSKSAITTSAELVALYPLSIFRSSPNTTTPTTSRSTFALYRFPLSAGIEKMVVSIYGRKVKTPSTRGSSGPSGIWTLEADEERCRWIMK